MDKKNANDENEWISLTDHRAIQDILQRDGAQVIMRKAERLDLAALRAYTAMYINNIARSHENEENLRPDEYNIKRAQVFEEGRVIVCTNPQRDRSGKITFGSLIYAMHIYNSVTYGLCSRMHLHTGERTGHLHCGNPAIILSLKPIILDREAQEASIRLAEDIMPGSENLTRYSAFLPSGTVAHIIFPQNTTHQFIGLGDNVLNFTIHSEEEDEMERNGIRSPNIKQQSIYFSERPPIFREYAEKLLEKFIGSVSKSEHLYLQLLDE